MEWDTSIPDYFKAIKIIEGCKTLSQLKTAEKYVQLFKEQYKLDESYSEFLDRSLFSKKMKLKNGWNNKN